MRVLHLISTIDPAAGGPTEVVRMLVELAPPGTQSEIVTVDAPSAPFLAAIPCPVHALGPPRTPLQYSPRLVPWLRANRSRFDGVIVHGLWSTVAASARVALHGHVPYVVFPHGMLDPWFRIGAPLKHARKWIYWHLAEARALRAAHRVLFTTAVERELAVQSFGNPGWRTEVTPLGAMPQPPATAADAAAFYARCPQVKGKRALLFLGRIHPKKGVDLLVEAFAAEASEHQEAGKQQDVHLVMAGPGEESLLAALRQAAERGGVGARVHFPGMLRDAAKAGAFACCEAFALPSHQENFGVAVVEAMAAGRPVLISNKVNIAPEIALDGCGLVAADTLAGTRSMLAKWFALTVDERAAMGVRASETAASRYDMRANTARILQTLRTP